MTLRIAGLLGLALGIALLTTAARAEAPAQVSPEVKELQRHVADLERRVKDLAAKADLDKITADLAVLTTLLKDEVLARQQIIADLQKQQEVLRSQQAELDQIVRGISTRDSSNQPIVNMSANMQSPQFREGFQGAVEGSLRRQGTLRVENQMATAQTIRVNGESHMVAAGGVKDVEVQVGTVVTELVGYESPKNWTVGAPRYVQRVVIEPKPAAYVPAATWVYDPVWGWVQTTN